MSAEPTIELVLHLRGEHTRTILVGRDAGDADPVFLERSRIAWEPLPAAGDGMIYAVVPAALAQERGLYERRIPTC